MRHEDLPNRWKEKLVEYLKLNGRNENKTLDVYAFHNSKTLKIKFEDGSFAVFKYAFTIDAPEYQETALFTEHCGYHIFNSGGIEIELVGKNDE